MRTKIAPALIAVLWAWLQSLVHASTLAPVDMERYAATTAVLGQRLTIRLPNRVGEARAWVLEGTPGPHLEFVASRFERPETELPGFKRDQIFEFNTRQAGQKVLTFHFGDPPARILKMTVTITGK